MSKVRNIAILIFNEVEVLDFCGPFEVFSVTGCRTGDIPFNVYTVAESEQVIARNNLNVLPTFTLDTCPVPDILVVPGGGGYYPDGTPFGTRREMHNETLLNWLRQTAANCETILSVCTGAMLLAKAGLTNNLEATTHHLAFDALRELDKSLTIHEDKRVVDNGKFIFSGGISAGIDASFYLVSKLLGSDIATETAKYMEYDWRSDKNLTLKVEKPE